MELTDQQKGARDHGREHGQQGHGYRQDEDERQDQRGRRDQQEHQEQKGTHQQDRRRPRHRDEEDQGQDLPEPLAEGGTLGSEGAIVQVGFALSLFRGLLERNLGVRVHD